MEGLIAIIFLIWAFSSAVKKQKQTSQGKVLHGEQIHSTPMEQSVEQPAHHKQHKAKKQEKTEQTSMSFSPAPRQHAREYQPIQPRVEHRGRLYDYVGSLGTVSNEGEASAEGEDFCDPSLGHEQAQPTSLMEPDVEMSPVNPLPEEWSAETLVQAVVMTEILKRPHGWGQR